MAGREKITALLNQLEQDLKQLEIDYERYFLNLEKRSPYQTRQKLALLMRKLLTYHIPQTDLRFRLTSISSRFHSYINYWDRIQRLIEEGKYDRHNARLQRQTGSTQIPRKTDLARHRADPVDGLYSQLVDVHQSCGIRPPNKDQVVRFLAKQERAIKQKFGDRPLEFRVNVEAGKTMVKVRAKG